MDLIHNGEKRGDIIWKVKVGSHAYGTNIEGSDEDFKGIYLQSPEDVLNRGYQEQVEVTKDECYFEIRRLLDLCCTGNPTMMEILSVPEDCIIYKHPVMDLLLPHREKFLSKSCRWSYGGYAIDQIKKASGLDKKMNWEEQFKTRKTVLEFCRVHDGKGGSLSVSDYLKEIGLDQKVIGLSHINGMKDCYAMFHPWPLIGAKYKGIADENSNDIKLSSIPKDAVRGYLTIMQFNKDEYTRHCKKYKEYTEWLNNRNVQRYVDVEEHGQKVDGKNLLHCIRLVEMGLEIAQGKGINVRRPNAGYLIEIRKGKHDLKSITEKAQKTIDELEEAFINSTLPEKVDRGFFMKLMVKIRHAYYNRSLRFEGSKAATQLLDELAHYNLPTVKDIPGFHPSGIEGVEINEMDCSFRYDIKIKPTLDSAPGAFKQQKYE